MRLCRECEAVLWRRHPSCPSCRAVAPGASAGPVLTRRRPRLDGLDRLAVAVALAAPALLLVVDHVLRSLLGPS